MTMPPLSNLRKKYFVDRGLQLRFTRFVVLFALGSSALTGLVVFYTVFMILGERLAQAYPQAQLVYVFRSVHLALVVNLFVVLPFLFYFSIKFSHRIAGPLPKIYQALRNMGRGNFDIKLTLRRNDELKELADIINETAKNLKERDIP